MNKIQPEDWHMKVFIHLKENIGSSFYMSSGSTQDKTTPTLQYISFRTKVANALRSLIYNTPVFNTMYSIGDLESFKALLLLNGIEFEEVKYGRRA